MLKIKKIEIENFGKFSDFTIDLNQTFQIIYGKNEDGKSTLMAFFNLVFYGDQPRTKKQMNIRQLYLPWSGKPMGGAIEFSHNDNNYRLQKQFATNAGKDDVKLINLDNSKAVGLPKGVEIGKHFFGLDLDGFNRTYFIKQFGKIGEVKKNDDVANMILSGFVENNDENGLQEDVVNRLDEAKQLMKSKTGSKGVLVETQQKLQSLKDEKENLRLILESQKKYIEEYRSLKNELENHQSISVRLENHEKFEKRSKLKNLIDKKQELQKLEKQLFINGFDKDMLQKLLDELAEKQNLISQKIQAATSFDNEENILESISKDEQKNLDDLIKKTEKIDSLLNEHEVLVVSNHQKNSELIFSFESISKEKKEIIQKIDSLSPELDKKLSLETEIEQAQRQKDFLSKQIAKITDDIKNESEAQKTTIKKLEESFVDPENAPTKSANLPMLILGMLTIIASIVGGFVISAMCYFGVLVGVCFLAFGVLSSKKTSKLKDDELKTKIEVENKAYSKHIESMHKDLHNLELEFVDISQKIEVSESNLGDLHESFQLENIDNLRARLRLVESELNTNQLEQQTIINNINAQKSRITDDLKLLGFEVSQDLHKDLQNAHDSTSLKIKQILLDKNANSIEDFNQKFHDFQSAQKNSSTILNIKQQIERLKNDFVNQFSLYRQNSDYEKSTVLLQQISDNYNEYNNFFSEITLLTGALGYQKYNDNELFLEHEKVFNLNDLISEQELFVLKENHEKFDQKEVIAKMEGLQQYLRPPKKSIEQFETEIAQTEEILKEQSFYYEALCLAHETMSQSIEEIRQSFGPAINKKTSEFFSRLTQSKYDDVLVNQSYDIQFRQGAHFREGQYLSNGTTDQAYLALRLAIAEIISQNDGAKPIFLDDVLVQYDDERAQVAMDFLSEYSLANKTQLIMFSCHKRTMSGFEENSISLENNAC